MSRGHETGFTLIEMLVAMVLVSMLLVVVSTVLMKSFGGSSKARQERAAIEATRSTFLQFGSDLRVARSPDRDPRYVGNSNDLSAALLQPEVEQIQLRVPGQPALVTLDLRDVVQASGTSFTFRADALPSAGVECVRYRARPADSAFVREVLNYRAAAGATPGACVEPPVQTRVLIEEVRR